MSDIDKATLLNLCDELHQVRGNISQLQATLNSVLSKAPNVDEYEELVKITNSETVTIENAELNSIYDRAKTYINSSQVKVAVRLKYLYNQGYLPLLLALAKINFKSLNNDKFVGYFLDYTPTPAVDIPDSLRNAVSPTKIKVDSSYPPTLPPISNPLLIQVLTDKTYRQPSDFIESSKYNDFSRSHNGKLYVKGKHLMNLILTQIIDDKYANIDEDDMIYMLSRYLDPLILTKFAFGYNLIDPFRYNLSNEISVEKKLNLFKKLFLAYVGGLDSEGYSTQEISIWIKKLYSPILTGLEPPNLYNESINQLRFFLKSFDRAEEMALTFDQIDSEPFVAQLSINGESMSVGTDSTSYDIAKSKAAYNLLNNETYKEKLLSILYNQYSPSYEEVVAPVSSGAEVSYDHTNILSMPPEAQLNYLHVLLAQHRTFARYVIRRVASEFTCNIYIKDIEIGTGTDISKKAAQEKATVNALSNEAVLKAVGISKP